MTTIRLVGMTIFIFVCSWCAAQAGTSAPIRLGIYDALNMAQNRQADILMSQERVQQALARLGQASSGLLPQVKGVLAGSRQSRDLRGQGIELPGDPHIGPFNALDARIKMTQAIFDPSAVSRLNEASKGRQLSVAENRKLKEDVLALVATLYINARQAEKDLKAQHAVLTSDRQYLRSVQVQYRQGTASAFTLDQAKNRQAQSYLGWRQASLQEVQARAELCAALDISFEQPIEYISDELDVPLPVDDKIDFQKHPDIDAAQMNVQLKTAQRGLERSGRLPQIVALADYGKSGESFDESSNTYTVGLQATIPIWEGGLRKERVKETESRLKESQIQLEKIKRETQARWMTALETIQQAQAFKNQADIQLRLAERQLLLSYKKFKMGNGSRLELLQSWSAKMQAHALQADSVSAYQSAQVNLAHAMGMLQELVYRHQQQEKP